jgi:hypothetical protein
MSDRTPSPEQQSAAFEEAIAYLDSLSPGELERRLTRSSPEPSANGKPGWTRSAAQAAPANFNRSANVN